MNITYWSDFACPFCYIGSNRLKHALKDMRINNVSFEFKSFQLDPEAPRESTESYVEHATHGIKELQSRAKAQMTNIANMAKEDDLEMNIFDVVPTNTMDAHRLLKLAQSRGNNEVIEDLVQRFYRIYFVEGKSIADHQILKEAALSAGLKEKDIDEVLSSDKFKDQVLQDRTELEKLGVNGVPYFIIDDKYAISGAQPYDVFVNAIKQIMAAENS